VSPLSSVAVVVEGVNIAKRHTKPRATGSTSDRMPKVQQGGILEIAQPMAISKVMVVCGSCDRPTRIKHATLDNGSRVRVCSHCGERLEVKA
jgi:large subunit ribosomal protein L24